MAENESFNRRHFELCMKSFENRCDVNTELIVSTNFWSWKSNSYSNLYLRQISRKKTPRGFTINTLGPLPNRRFQRALRDIYYGRSSVFSDNTELLNYTSQWYRDIALPHGHQQLLLCSLSDSEKLFRNFHINLAPLQSRYYRNKGNNDYGKRCLNSGHVVSQNVQNS